MRHTSLAFLLLSLLATAAPALGQSSEREGVSLRSEPNTELRLREWLRYRAEGSDRTWQIVGGFASAAGITGLGAYGLVDDDNFGGPIGRMYVALGVLSFATPIVLLATQNHPELDLENLPDRALTEREIGYYEGLLHGEARLGRAMRIGRGIQGGFMTVAGSLGFALTLDDVGFRNSPVEAGVYLGVGIGGLIVALSAFFKAREERIWDGYSAGVVPDAEAARIELRGDGVQLSF